MLYCSINYQQVNALSVQDRGLAYGDGLFTTAKIKNGRIEMQNAHLERLKTGCVALALNTPDFTLLNQQITDAAKNYPLAVIKVMITAGSGGRGYSRQGILSSNVIIMVFDFPKHYLTWQQQGINLGVAQSQLGLSAMLAGIKHLNRLEQVLIRQELDTRPEDDLVVLDINNNVVESSCANIFWCKNNVWQTPRITQTGIAGLMRAKIIASNNVVEVVNVKLVELDDIEAAFICNSVMGIVPIKIYNKQPLSLSLVNALVNDLLPEYFI